MKKTKYAKQRLDLIIEEMGEIKKVFISDNGKVFIEMANGMNLELADDEIKFQATEFLESEIEGVKRDF